LYTDEITLLFKNYKRRLQRKLTHALAAQTFIILSQLYIDVNTRTITSNALQSCGMENKRNTTRWWRHAPNSTCKLQTPHTWQWNTI